MGSHMCAQPSTILYLSVMDLMMTTWLVETYRLFDTFMVIKEYCCADVLFLYKTLYTLNMRLQQNQILNTIYSTKDCKVVSKE